MWRSTKLKAADGKVLTDRYLKDRLVPRNDWMPAVYAETSGYIHFSNRHIKAALRLVDKATGRVELLIGPQEIGKSISYYGELLRAFRHLNMMIPVAAGDWLSRLKQAGSTARHLCQGLGHAQGRSTFAPARPLLFR